MIKFIEFIYFKKSPSLGFSTHTPKCDIKNYTVVKKTKKTTTLFLPHQYRKVQATWF